jgi:hypothetical protein
MNPEIKKSTFVMVFFRQKGQRGQTNNLLCMVELHTCQIHVTCENV